MNWDTAYALAHRIAQLRSNDTIPTEDVIDLAQAVEYILNVIKKEGLCKP